MDFHNFALMDEKSLFLTQLDQDAMLHKGLYGRPPHYPEPEMYPNRLFYIQRNQNTNAVIYEANTLHGGLLNLSNPITVNWVEFDPETGAESTHGLNQMQKKLAYGYNFEVIHHDLIRFNFVSYSDLTLYLAKTGEGDYRVVTQIEGTKAFLHRIYIYAEDFGVFPQVRFAELFGKNTETQLPVYQKLIIQ